MPAGEDEAEVGLGHVGAEGENGSEGADGSGLRDGDWEGWDLLVVCSRVVKD